MIGRTCCLDDMGRPCVSYARPRWTKKHAQEDLEINLPLGRHGPFRRAYRQGVIWRSNHTSFAWSWYQPAFQETLTLVPNDWQTFRDINKLLKTRGLRLRWRKSGGDLVWLRLEKLP